MAAPCVMKQAHEKHLSIDILLCSWNSKIDVIALANSSGHILLHRHSWQKIWSFEPQIETPIVTEITWRPDGKVLAAAYNSGQIFILHVEDGSVLNELHSKENITCLHWFINQGSEKYVSQEQDPWFDFMFGLPLLGKSFGDDIGIANEEWKDPVLIKDQNELTVLVAGTESSVINLYAYGLFHIASLNLRDSIKSAKKIISVQFSADLGCANVYIEKNPSRKQLVRALIDTTILSSRHAEISCLAQKYGQIYSLMAYTKKVISLIQEAWETTLLEMDNKLESYASKVEEGAVSADFLELLVFGYASHELELFLTTSLTDKGIKKLQTCVNVCYSNIQKLLAKNLNSVCLTLMFLLSHINGMAGLKDKYDNLGIVVNSVNEAMKITGSFMLKASEMLQVTEGSMHDFLNFLKWLSNVRVKYTQETPTPESGKFSMREVDNITEFLSTNFEKLVIGPDGKKCTRFNLERVAKYLKDEDIKNADFSIQNPWTKLLKENQTLAKHPLIFNRRPSKSLIQEHNCLVNALTKLGFEPRDEISRAIKVTDSCIVANISSSTTVRQIYLSSKCSFMAGIVDFSSADNLLINKWLLNAQSKGQSIYASRFHFSSLTTSKCNHDVLDFHFYDDKILSVLLKSESSNIFAQLLCDSLSSNLQEIPGNKKNVTDVPLSNVDTSTFIHITSRKSLESTVFMKFYINQPRKWALFLSESKRRVRVYEMEQEEDDEEMEDSTTSVNVTKSADQNDSL